MKIQVPYGKNIEECSVPDQLAVTRLLPSYGTPASSAEVAIQKALSALIGPVPIEKFRSARQVAIAISDITRPVPLKILLAQLLDMLNTWGVPDHKIIGIVGGGLHRPATQADLSGMIGEDLLNRFRVIAHDATDKKELLYIGTSAAGTPIYINQAFYHADVRIVTGMLEPHQFMGFSAGVKGAVIGLGGQATIEKNHGRLFHEDADLGILDSNPVRKDLEDIGAHIGIDLIVNVILNDKKQVLCAVAGHPVEAYHSGVCYAKKIFGVPVTEADIVITSPGGFPKDINVYQAQKALTPAGRMVRKGGMIILVAECLEDLGEHRFAEEMQKYASPQEIIEQFPKHPFLIGNHKAYLWARTLAKAETVIVSRKLPKDREKLLMSRIMPNLQEAITYALAKKPASRDILVLPAASSTIPVFDTI